MKIYDIYKQWYRVDNLFYRGMGLKKAWGFFEMLVDFSEIFYMKILYSILESTTLLGKSSKW